MFPERLATGDAITELSHYWHRAECFRDCGRWFHDRVGRLACEDALIVFEGAPKRFEFGSAETVGKVPPFGRTWFNHRLVVGGILPSCRIDKAGFVGGEFGSSSRQVTTAVLLVEIPSASHHFVVGGSAGHADRAARGIRFASLDPRHDPYIFRAIAARVGIVERFSEVVFCMVMQ